MIEILILALIVIAGGGGAAYCIDVAVNWKAKPVPKRRAPEWVLRSVARPRWRDLF